MHEQTTSPKKRKPKISNKYDWDDRIQVGCILSEVHKFRVIVNTLTYYTIIYGKAGKNWFIAVPALNVCIETEQPSDDAATSKLFSAALNDDEELGIFLARAVKEHCAHIQWEKDIISGKITSVPYIP